jgi:hypothetical protein
MLVCSPLCAQKAKLVSSGLLATSKQLSDVPVISQKFMIEESLKTDKVYNAGECGYIGKAYTQAL